MNAGEFERRNNLTIMATSTSIAKKARSKAEAICACLETPGDDRHSNEQSPLFAVDWVFSRSHSVRLGGAQDGQLRGAAYLK